MLNKIEIDNAKHIVIVLQNNPSIDALGCGNALYTYLLQLHKKVSFYCEEFAFGLNMQFLPWIDKMRSSFPSSADLEIKVGSSVELFDYFRDENIKLNPKMATSLYAGLLDSTNGFTKNVAGTKFAMAKVLIESKADVESCTKNVLHFATLASLRLKTILLKKMSLINNAELAVFNLEDDDLKASGATKADSYGVLIEALNLPSVLKAVVVYRDKEIYNEEI